MHRIEKIKFAADKHIQDKTLAQSLEAQADHMLELYNRLNKAHSDKPLPRNEVIQLLTAIRGVIEEWTDAMRF